MVRKSKDDAPNPQGIVNRDIIQRMNFLYQASGYLASINQPTPKHGSPVGKSRSRRKSKCPKVDASDISANYIGMMKTVGKKTLVKIDPGVKRTLCKGCNALLQPGVNVSVRVKKLPSHGHAVAYSCDGCKTSRRIPAPPILSEGIALNPAVDRSLHTPAEPNTSTPALAPLKGPLARRPPLFARREVGHIIYSGNKKLDVADQGGLFAM